MAVRRNEPQPILSERRNQSHEARTSNRNYLAVPMDDYEREVVECVRDNQSAVIIGETGSGKTTRIPDFLLESFPDAKIAITQPRRVATRSVARYVASRRNEELGNEIGYQVRFEDQTNEGTRANFMTDGILLRKLQYDHLLSEYDIVMVDEAHERSLNIDFVLGLLKRAQTERKKQGLPELKVIVTSATIEKEKFSKYFGDAPMVEVPGRMYPVEVNYETRPVNDYPKAAAEKVEQISATKGEGDILIFMPGEDEIRRTIKEINDLKLPDLEVMPLYGALSPDDQDRIFEKSNKRKVIVSTNIAETSLTIDGIGFVIDSGLIKQKEFNPDTGIEALVTEMHAKSGCQQRSGRAGRTGPGVCYRLYTENDFKNRADYQTPEIARSNLDHVILAMKKIGIDDVRNFEFIDPPKEASIAQAIETLIMLGALDDKEELTELGMAMAELPLRPEIAKMVIEAEKYGCTGKICTIAAMMGEKSIFVRPKDKEFDADTAHSQFYKADSDFLKMLAVWDKWSATGFDERWARENFLNVRQLFEVREVRAQLMRELRNQDIAVDDINGDDEIAIQKCIASGMIQHLMIYSGRHSYDRAIKRQNDPYNYITSESIFAHPSSVAFSSQPRLMIGANVVTTSRTFARQCQKVDPKWLPEIAPQLLEETDKTVRYDLQSGKVIEDVEYSIRGRYGVIVKIERETTAEAVANEKIIKALTDGEINLPCVKNNAEVIRSLKVIQNRSGGRIQVPDLKLWYQKQAKGVTNKDELTQLGDKLYLRFADYCSPEMIKEIEKEYPETIIYQGTAINIIYNYRPANLAIAYGEGRNEKFTAVATIPVDILFKLTPDAFDQLRADNRLEITYRSSLSGNEFLSDSDLEALKIQLDNRRLETVVWPTFKKPEVKIIETKIGEPLPWLDSIGAYPIPYGKNYKGEIAFAYPAYTTESTYNFINGTYNYTYKLSYFCSEADAKYFNEASHATKSREDALAQKRIENQTLLAPVKARYEAMQSRIDGLESAYSNYGMSYEEYYRLREKWGEVRYNIAYIESANPKEADRLMDEIEVSLAKGKEERDRRLLLIPEVKAKEAKLFFKVTKLTYANYPAYGLTYANFHYVQNMWLEVQKMLETVDRHGDEVMPNPERASKLIDELDVIISNDKVTIPPATTSSYRSSLFRPYQAETIRPAKETLGGATLGDAWSGKQKKTLETKQIKPTTKETARPIEKEAMTDELRDEFMNDLVNVRFYLDSARAIPEPDKKADNADKISKLRARSAELKSDLNALERELKASDDVARIRGKVNELTTKSEKVAREIVRLIGGREDWTTRYNEFFSRVSELAEIQETELTDELLDKIKPKIITLSRRQGEINDIDGELEAIIIDAL